MGSKVSLQTIANKMNVTKVTVHRALRNHPGVGQKLKEEIIKCAEELGYSADKPLLMKISKNLAYFIPARYFYESEKFYNEIYYNLKAMCDSADISIRLFPISSSDEKNMIFPDEINKESFSGIFIAGNMDKNFILAVKRTSIPLVLIDYFHKDLDCSAVVADNYYMGYTAALHLIENGHKNIGFVGNYKKISNITDRCLGMQKALMEYDLPINYDNFILNNNYETGLYTVNFDIPNPLPTAFICFCDMAAHFLHEKLKVLNIKVPDEVSIISFDNTEISNNFEPPLTSIYVSRKDFANAAFESIAEQINSPENAPQKIILPFTSAIRSSVKNIKDFS